MVVIDFSPKIDREKLAKMLGDKNHQGLSPSLAGKIDIHMAGIDALLTPRLDYRTLEIGSTENGILELKEGMKFASKKLAKTMSRCVEAISFIATIGENIENKINKLTADNQLSDAFILDSMGSLLVEGFVNQFQQNMQNKYLQEKRSTSIRFSPGYCDWPIVEQKKLFELFNKDSIAVRLNDACLMSPRKSISGIFGISSRKTREWVSAYNPCTECGKKGCSERRKQRIRFFKTQ